jgi:TusA-related sulfurtransferase
MKEVQIKNRKIEIVSTIDAAGLYCPMPIVHLKRELEKLKSNQVVEILADDPSFEKDITSWCQASSNKLLWVSRNQDDIYVAYVEKF